MTCRFEVAGSARRRRISAVSLPSARQMILHAIRPRNDPILYRGHATVTPGCRRLGCGRQAKESGKGGGCAKRHLLVESSSRALLKGRGGGVDKLYQLLKLLKDATLTTGERIEISGGRDRKRRYRNNTGLRRELTRVQYRYSVTLATDHREVLLSSQTMTARRWQII